MIDIKVPTVGESISEVSLLKWTKPDGAWVERDEVIAELESEKATFEVNAEQAGILTTVGKEGDTLNIGDVLNQKSIYYLNMDDKNVYSPNIDKQYTSTRFGTNFTLGFNYNFSLTK